MEPPEPGTWSPLGELELRGAGGEPVDLRRCLASHGVAMLPPNQIDEQGLRLTTTLALGEGRARTVSLIGGAGRAELWLAGGPLGEDEAGRLRSGVRHMLALDQDLSAFYRLAARDPQLSWCCAGAGRMLRSASVFEDVVKTICTTNCSWSATVRMVSALVGELGAPDGLGRHAFPEAEGLAGAGEDFYRGVARAGYRGAYLRAISRAVVAGELDLEGLADPSLDDDGVRDRLLALPGVGPYAAAHIMQTSLGRCRHPVLDSWTRPTYARLCGHRATDRGILRRFRRYRDFQGLAFWLFLTRDWVEE